MPCPYFPCAHVLMLHVLMLLCLTPLCPFAAHATHGCVHCRTCYGRTSAAGASCLAGTCARAGKEEGALLMQKE